MFKQLSNVAYTYLRMLLALFRPNWKYKAGTQSPMIDITRSR